jgi:hypothetical protein
MFGLYRFVKILKQISILMLFAIFNCIDYYGVCVTKIISQLLKFICCR